MKQIHVKFTISESEVSGRVHVKTDDGQEIDFSPGAVVDIPPGHDG
ncbi:MAG: cupin domain-containing protein [Crenarchaeota archaeon]|nr:cupin domain-containing protein [Thermoproteota archaeon]